MRYSPDMNYYLIINLIELFQISWGLGRYHMIKMARAAASYKEYASINLILSKREPFTV